jgi:tRNA (guanine-N7-)-methyltransferase
LSKNRIRQHVNPLSRKFQQQLTIPDWQQIYSQIDLPLHLDIGCARGKFLLEMAQLYPDRNFLGIEIRQPLVIDANETKNQLGLSNLYYLFGNMNVEASKLLASLPLNVLRYITIQFPDPWFKKKHNKRRVVQSELVDTLVNCLATDGIIFLQSDIQEVAIEMRDRFAANSLLMQQHQKTWLDRNPLPVSTERELYVTALNLPIYRVLFQKFPSN